MADLCLFALGIGGHVAPPGVCVVWMLVLLVVFAPSQPGTYSCCSLASMVWVTKVLEL